MLTLVGWVAVLAAALTLGTLIGESKGKRR